MSNKNIRLRNYLEGSTRVPEMHWYKEWQEPTYIGFTIEFDFETIRSDIEESKFDSLTNHLLMNPSDEWSAVQYLRNINEPGRARSLEVFITMLKDITQKAPWYFQSITGIGSILKIDPSQNFRGSGSDITISTIESLDLKITAMKDLYKKAAWDAINHRWMLPENMRFFRCNIILHDYRDFHRTGFLEPVDEFVTNEYDVNKSIFDSTFDPISNIKKSITNQFHSSVNNIVRKISKIKDTNKEWFVNNLVGDNTWKPGIILTLDNCMFDMFSDAPSFVETLNMGTVPEEATQEIKFSVGNIKESAYYSNLKLGIGVRVDDEHIKGSKGKFGISKASSVQMEAREELSQEEARLQNQIRDSDNIDNREKGKFQDKFDEYTDNRRELTTDVLADTIEEQVRDRIAGRITAAWLGNVYGFSPSDFTRRAGAFDPAADIINEGDRLAQQMARDGFNRLKLGDGKVHEDYSISLDSIWKTNNRGLINKNIQLQEPVSPKQKTPENIEFQEPVSPKQKSSENIEFQKTIASKQIANENIDLKEPTTTDSKNLGNMGFSGPPAV